MPPWLDPATLAHHTYQLPLTSHLPSHLSPRRSVYGITPLPEGLPELKPEDMRYFADLAADVDEAELSLDEQKRRKIMKLLLKVKNGTPP